MKAGEEMKVIKNLLLWTSAYEAETTSVASKKVVVLECKLKIGFKTICRHVREEHESQKLNCCYQMESKIHCCHCWLIYSNQFIRSSLLSIRCPLFPLPMCHLYFPLKYLFSSCIRQIIVENILFSSQFPYNLQVIYEVLRAR